MRSSEELFARAERVSPGGVHSPVRAFKGLDRPPVFFQKAEGAFLYSVEGERKIDFCMSFGPLILGHLDPDVREEVHKMVDTSWTFGAAEPYSLALAEWMTRELPWLEKIRFVSSGTEAVMSAVRVARAASGRNKILKFDGCYHGHADCLLVKAGSGLAGKSAASSAGVPTGVIQDTIIVPLDDEASLRNALDAHGKDIAAVILEPLPANYGLLPQRAEFLRAVEAACRASGIFLIFDEVISGFRAGCGGMAAQTGIRPDLATYGKVIGGGFPVACYGGRKDLMDLVAPAGPVYQAGTLSANPVGMVAGLATLQKMRRINGWNILRERMDRFAGLLRKGFEENGVLLEVVHQDSIFWIRPSVGSAVRSVAAIPEKLSETFKPLFLKSLSEGVYLAPSAYEVGFISLAHTDEILERAARAIVAASSARADKE